MRVLVAGLSLLVFVSCGASVAVAGGPIAAPEIVVGMSTVLSGPASDLGQEMRRGVLAAFERANRAGGVHGRRLRLIALDDGYEPARTAPNMRQLLEKDNVLAVIGNVGTPTAIAAIPIADEQKTLFFAPFTGAGILHKNPQNRYVFNYRASYEEETAAMIDALLGPGGLKPEEIAAFTQSDGYGDAGFNGIVTALKHHGLKDEKQLMHVRYERNTLAVENALASLLYAEHEPRAVIMIGAYTPCAKFIKLAHEAGLKAVFVNVSFVGSKPLGASLGKLPVQVIVTQVVPYPLDARVPVVHEYQLDMAAIDPSAQPGFGSLEGYVATRIFLAALETIPGTPTREGIVDALEGLGKFDVGLEEPMEFGPGDHDACHRVWPTILRDGVFVPFAWTDMAALLKPKGTP